jgi:exopolysaccharide biosynthesis polyprenyl glycosylphosphotransferase
MRSTAYYLLRLAPWVDATLAAVIIALVWNSQFHRAIPDFFIVLLVVPFWVYLFQFFGLYESHRIDDPVAVVRKVLSAQIIGLAALSLSLWLFGNAGALRSGVSFVTIFTAVMIGQRWLIYFTLRTLRRRGFDAHRVLVIGSWETAHRTAKRFSEHPEWGLAVACVGAGLPTERRYLRYPSGEPFEASSLEEVLKNLVIDEVLIAVHPFQFPHEKATILLCEQYGVLGRVLLDEGEDQSDSLRLESFYGSVSFTVGGVRRSTLALTLKRFIDVSLAVVLVVALSPLMLFVALLVKLSSPGPVIFSQTRVGLRGRRFKIYKFRTMIDGAEALLPSLALKSMTRGPIFKDTSDTRVTDVGRILRRFSLDELPQLINVLKGDMSLVGPRPLPVHESDAISGEYRRRFSMRPGITCLWQVNGRSDVEYTKWMGYDLEYVDEWSLYLDARVLLRTIPVVLLGKGAY